jgi:hypothetical protein
MAKREQTLIPSPVTRVEHQPGNGTRYEVFLFEIEPEGDWIMTAPEFHLTMRVSPGMYLHESFVIEKAGFGRYKTPISTADAIELARVAASVVPAVTAP